MMPFYADENWTQLQIFSITMSYAILLLFSYIFLFSNASKLQFWEPDYIVL